MSKTFNLTIPFDLLLQAIAKLSLADKQLLWEFLDTDLHDSTDEAPMQKPTHWYSAPPEAPGS